MFNTLGTPNNLAIWDFLNQQKVPQLYVATGASDWGKDIKAHPYTIGWQPNYVTEAKVYADYLKKEKPNAKVAVLYQNDGFGKDLLGGFEEGISGSDIKVVKEETYNATDPTVAAQVGRLARSGADTFLSITTPKFAAQGIATVAKSGWKPLQILNNVGADKNLVLKPVGLANAKGAISTVVLQGPAGPAVGGRRGDEGVQGRDEAVRAQGRTPRTPSTCTAGPSPTTMAKALEQMKEPTRAALMDAVRNMTLEQGTLLPGEKIETSPDDGYPLEAMQIIKFDGQNWKLQGDLIQAKARLGGSRMLEGLMQHDHPLTLQLVLERMRGMNGDAEVVTLTDDGTTRATYAEVGERVDRLCRGLRELGVGDGDRVATFAWNSQHHLEAYLAAPCMGAVLHTLNIRLFPEQLVYVVNHAQDKVILVDALAGRRARRARRPVRDGRALRGDGRRRPLQAPERDQLRGAARAPGAGLRLPGDRRPRGRRAVLHERDDRQPEGRPLLAQVEHPPHDGAVHDGRVRHLALRPHPAGGADVPRQRVGPALRGVLRGREPDHAQPLPAGRAAGAADRVGEGHGRRRGADDLARRPALVGRAQARPLEHPDRGLRRRRRPAPADAGVRGAPRDEDHPGVGHDRDEPARLRRPPAGRPPRARSTGTTARRPGGSCRSCRRG